MNALTIQEAAQTTDWSPRMLRYIERAGLIEPQRSEAGYRLYGPGELQRLRTLRELATRFGIGLAEIGSVPMTIDTRELGAITPEVRAAVAVNPDSTAIPVARSNGILTAGVFPQGGLIAGRGSAMNTDGWTTADMTLRGDVGLVLTWPRFKIEESLRQLDEFVAKARAWQTARAADRSVQTDLRLAAMGPALRRQTKVFVRANEENRIVRFPCQQMCA